MVGSTVTVGISLVSLVNRLSQGTLLKRVNDNAAVVLGCYFGGFYFAA